jgi:hypothetical protein
MKQLNRVFGACAGFSILVFSHHSFGSPYCGFPPGTVVFAAVAKQPFTANLNRMVIDPTVDTVFSSTDLPMWLSLDRNGILTGTSPETASSEAFHLTALCEALDDQDHPASITVQ